MFQARLTGPSGSNVVVEALVIFLAWTPITSANGSGSLSTATGTDPAPDSKRFYRLLRPPPP